MEGIDFRKLIQQNESDYVDNTDGIRRLKHSELIRDDILKLERLKKKRGKEPNFTTLCQQKCSFLYNAYTDIFHKVLKDELDLNLMQQALYTLHKIETGSINQQEGSILMGKLFYEIYVDSALKKSEKLEVSSPSFPSVPDFSWKEWKDGKK